MKLWPILSFIPALIVGIYLGTHSKGANQTVRTFVDMRLPADTESDFTVNLSREINLDEIGPANFIFNSRLDKNNTSFGITSQSFYMKSGDQFLDVCDFLNNNDGFVSYKLVAEGVANSGENIEIDVSKNCNGFDYVELLPFEFCDPEFDEFKNEIFETEASNFNFINFSDFMPKTWYLREVFFAFENRMLGELEKDFVYYNPADPIVISCSNN